VVRAFSESFRADVISNHSCCDVRMDQRSTKRKLPAHNPRSARSRLVVVEVYTIVSRKQLPRMAFSTYFTVGCEELGNLLCGRYRTSSVMTVKFVNFAFPNDVVMAQSVASRPVAIKTRPMRRTLCLASKVHQRSPR
jgi:hypothetical protein